MYYDEKEIRSFWLLDTKFLSDPQEMRSLPNTYGCPDDPASNMSASQVRDLMNIVAHVSNRLSGSPDRIQWYMLLEGSEKLVHVEDYNLISDY